MSVHLYRYAMTLDACANEISVLVCVHLCIDVPSISMCARIYACVLLFNTP